MESCIAGLIYIKKCNTFFLFPGGDFFCFLNDFSREKMLILKMKFVYL